MKIRTLIILLLSFNAFAGNKVLLPDNSTYYGKITNGLFNDTKGLLIWTNGARYVGGFKNGLMDGVGKMLFANKSYYEGEFKNGLINGIGTFTFGSGVTYYGQFKNDLFHGTGELIYKNGDIYQGQFKKDMFDGKGVFYFASGYIIDFDGVFRENFAIKGTISFNNGDSYTGEVNREMLPHGAGIYTEYKKTPIKGIFKNGLLLNNQNKKI